MVSVNGISLRNQKMLKGPQGLEYPAADVFLGDVQIASWKMNEDGDNIFEMKPGYSWRKLNNAILKANEDKTKDCPVKIDDILVPIPTGYNIDCLMHDIKELPDIQALLIEAINEGYIGVLTARDYKFNTLSFKLGKEYKDMSDEEIIEAIKPDIREAISEDEYFSICEEWYEYNIYRSLKDFEVGTPINLTEIQEGQVK